MRWHILRTLIVKEALRHFADRGGIMMAVLLVAAALLLSVFGKDDVQANPFAGGVQLCYLDWWQDSYWLKHLYDHQPKNPNLKLVFRPAQRFRSDMIDKEDNIIYPANTGAIQMRLNGQDGQGRPRFKIMFWYPGKDPAVLAPYVEWFWKESLQFYKETPIEIETAEDQVTYPAQAALIQVQPTGKQENRRPIHKLLFWRSEKRTDAPRPVVEIEESREPLRTGSDERSKIAAILVFFPLFLFCVYLLSAFTCEEHEKGILLAQALSPASAQEILAGKFLFYPLIGMALSSVLAAIYRPGVLAMPFFWLSLCATAVGYLGVGMTIASLARSQRSASMGSLCYLLTTALFLFLTERFGIPSVQYLELEYYCPNILEAALQGTLAPWHWLKLLAASLLASGWFFLATVLFRKRGWQ